MLKPNTSWKREGDILKEITTPGRNKAQKNETSRNSLSHNELVMRVDLARF